MVTVTVAIGQFVLMLLEALLWAAVAGGGILVIAVLAVGSVYLVGRRLLRGRKAGR